MKYILSDSKYSFYKYGDWDFPAFCRGNNFPQFHNGSRWVEVRSFLEFADNAVAISEAEFREKLSKFGVAFEKKDDE